MRRMRLGLLVLGMVLIVLSSCAHDESFKPPKPEPEYKVPPLDDPRFSNYVQYPEKAMDKGWDKKSEDLDPVTPASQKMPARPSAGMSGPGMGSGM